MVYYCPQYYPILISRYNHQKSGLCFEFGHPIALPPGWTVWQSRPRYPMTSLLWSSTLLPGCSSVATSPPSGGTGPLSHQGSAFPPIHWELSGVRMLRSFGMIVVMGGGVVWGVISIIRLVLYRLSGPFYFVFFIFKSKGALHPPSWSVSFCHYSRVSTRVFIFNVVSCGMLGTVTFCMSCSIF